MTTSSFILVEFVLSKGKLRTRYFGENVPTISASEAKIFASRWEGGRFALDQGDAAETFALIPVKN